MQGSFLVTWRSFFWSCKMRSAKSQQTKRSCCTITIREDDWFETSTNPDGRHEEEEERKYRHERKGVLCRLIRLCYAMKQLSICNWPSLDVKFRIGSSERKGSGFRFQSHKWCKKFLRFISNIYKETSTRQRSDTQLWPAPASRGEKY